MANEAPQNETLIEFPCDFPIKVMGTTYEDFANSIVQIIQQYEPSFNATKVEMRASSNGKYISLTCNVYVETKVQLDKIYHALNAHPAVKYLL